MSTEYYRPLPDGITIKESKIEGLGLFATKNIIKGEIIGLTHVYSKGFPDNYIRTPLGGFINYDENPNCAVMEDETTCHQSALWLYSIREIKSGEEITLKYHLYDPTK
tara:strand:+ start:21 stop:344 length:324 start_codon:yes stop_codon:yes gene_type:complete